MAIAESGPVACVLLVAASIVLVIATLRDIATRTIPNWSSIAVLGIGLLLRGASGQLLAGLGLAASLLALGVVLWQFGALGGGDAKLLAATSTLIPFPQSLLFLPSVALCGGVLAVFYLIAQRIAFAQRNSGRDGARVSLPYGAAIAAGAVVSLVRA